jgi:DNA polymerase III subunit gamma/tau
MSYQVLARKYRPQRFSEVIGQEHVTRTLKNALEQQRIAHGYIFSGHRGIGKTTIARILAMALNCRTGDRPQSEPCGICDSCTEIRAGNDFDVIEIDAATNRGIDEVRRIREEARSQPARDRYKIFILDEAHQITDAAFNAILKTLEEPPPWAVFMMATTQPEDIPQTIRSRCQHFSFHAVRFDEIVQQLRSIAEKENIQADDQALAVLAEAGDGSMRDALSIMDQAIACCAVFSDAGSAAKLTAEQVRGLMGNVSSEVMEEVMNCVAQNSSQQLLQLLNRLLTEGQSPAHFAKQLVRFLRNILMAKVAGPDSPLLQISADERARVVHVAEWFSEEDLTRFLQIMLRTHDELGYRPEQRFHLELGVLKMVHAQRLLPVEELLSQVAPGSQVGGQSAISGGVRKEPAAPVRVSALPEDRSAGQRQISPFEADRARKVADESRKPQSSVTPFVSGLSSSSQSSVSNLALATAPLAQEVEKSAPAEAELTVELLRNTVLSALENQGQRTTASMLESGEWSLEGSELIVKAATTEKMIDLMVNPEVKRIAQSEASRVAGRPVKFKVLPGGTPQSATPAGNGSRTAPAGSARSRAADDPVVRRMQEKFGAEVRSVIDYRERHK